MRKIYPSISLYCANIIPNKCKALRFSPYAGCTIRHLYRYSYR